MTTAAREKIGLDANLPIDPKTGAIRPQVFDPDVIAGTGTRWVRLNFVLGPWSSPSDRTLRQGRSWAQTYERILAGLRQKGLSIYGLIGCEAMPQAPGDQFRNPPPAGSADDEWMSQYVERAVAIAQMFRHHVQILESFNEPDDWHGQKRNWIHPGWFAIMLQRLYSAVRSKAELQRIRLVSGPLQGLETNRNAAANYLSETYRAGKERFGWGQPGIPFPFDGVGYHLYVKSGYEPSRALQARAIRATCRRYLDAMHQVIRQEEGQDKPLYVSEVGWSSSIDYQAVQRRELFQAYCLRAGLETVASDPLVELGCWFCTQDFPSPRHDANYGLYRLGEPAPENRKPAFQVFKALCEGTLPVEAEEEPVTNQEVIAAFYSAAVELGLPSRWSLLAKAGLSLSKLAANREAPYTGLPIADLPNLTKEEKALVKEQLGAATGEVEASGLGLAAAGAAVSGQRFAASAAQPDQDLPAALQSELADELAKNRELLERLVDDTQTLKAGNAGALRSWLTAAIVTTAVNLVLLVVLVVRLLSH